jgi:tetratricopeptide (TPR) repeat protein
MSMENKEENKMKLKVTVICVMSMLVLAAGVYLWAGKSPEAKRDKYLKDGRQYMEQGKVNEAVITFKNAVKTDPASAEAHYELGLGLLNRGDFRGAFGQFHRASDLEPQMVEPQYQIANLYVLARDIPKAKEQLSKIREKDPNSFQARYLTASIAIAEKDPDKALKELEKIVAEDPQGTTAEIVRAYLGIAGIHALKRNYEAAEGIYRKVLRIDPKSVVARGQLVSLYITMGEVEKAESELLQATEAEPESEGLLHLLGRFYSFTRKVDDYEKLYRDFLKK